MEGNSRPGVMLYFEDLKPMLEYLNDEQLGLLMKAILSYAENGEWVGESCDGNVRFALRTLKPKIGRDGEAYSKKKLHGQYMTYVRMARDEGRQPLSEQEWINAMTVKANMNT